MVDVEKRLPERHLSQSLPDPKRHLTLIFIMPSGTCFLPSWLVSRQQPIEPVALQRRQGGSLPLVVSPEIFLIADHSTSYDKYLIFFLKKDYIV